MTAQLNPNGKINFVSSRKLNMVEKNSRLTTVLGQEQERVI